MRSGDARKNFPQISINNVITLATRVRSVAVLTTLHFHRNLHLQMGPVSMECLSETITLAYWSHG